MFCTYIWLKSMTHDLYLVEIFGRNQSINHLYLVEINYSFTMNMFSSGVHVSVENLHTNKCEFKYRSVFFS